MNDESVRVINEKGIWLDAFKAQPTQVSDIVGFTYLYTIWEYRKSGGSR